MRVLSSLLLGLALLAGLVLGIVAWRKRRAL